MKSTGQSDKRHLTEVPGAQSYSRKTNSSSSNPEIPFNLRYLKVHHFVQNNPPLVSMLGHMNPDHVLPRRCSISFNITLPTIPWISKLSLSFKFPHHNPARISVLPIYATCPAHRIFLDLTFGIIFDGEYISRSSSLCGLLLLNGKIMTESTESPVETTLPGLSTYCR